MQLSTIFKIIVNIFVYLQEHDMFRDMTRKWFEKEVVPFHSKWEKDGHVPREVICKLRYNNWTFFYKIIIIVTVMAISWGEWVVRYSYYHPILFVGNFFYLFKVSQCLRNMEVLRVIFFTLQLCGKSSHTQARFLSFLLFSLQNDFIYSNCYRLHWSRIRSSQWDCNALPSSLRYIEKKI